MRLSLGQDLRLVQKQVLAPRMIQSMEILQLPILALEERIEQEMQENPVLELQEDDPDLPGEPADGSARMPEAPDAPTEEERELVIDETHSNEDDFERLMKMDEEWPDHFEERSRPSRGELEEAGERKLDAMANMTARPQSLQDYLHDQLGWFDLEPPCGDGRADHLQPRQQRLSARPAGRPARRRRRQGRAGPGRSGRWPWCSGSTRPAWRPAISASACCCS